MPVQSTCGSTAPCGINIRMSGGPSAHCATQLLQPWGPTSTVCSSLIEDELSSKWTETMRQNASRDEQETTKVTPGVPELPAPSQEREDRSLPSVRFILSWVIHEKTWLDRGWHRHRRSHWRCYLKSLCGLKLGPAAQLRPVWGQLCCQLGPTQTQETKLSKETPSEVLTKTVRHCGAQHSRRTWPHQETQSLNQRSFSYKEG